MSVTYHQQMRIGTRAALSRWVAPLWPVTLLAMLIGAGIGALVLHTPRVYTAACVIRVDPPVDPNDIMTNQLPFPGLAPDFLGSQIAYLNSQGFLNSVSTRLRRPDATPDLVADQYGMTNLVTITGTAGSAEDARATVDAAVQTYSDHIKKVESLRTSQSLQAIALVIDRLEENMRERGQPLSQPGDDLGQLYLQRTELQVQLVRPPGVAIVTPTADQPSQGKLSMPALGAAIGGFAAGLIALTAAQLWRSRVGILLATDPVDEGRLLRPVLPLRRTAIDPSIARTLYAQLSPPAGSRIVVVGASAGSGASTVAQYLAYAARECGPVITDSVFDRDPAEGEAGASDASAVVISDGGDLGSSPDLIEFVGRATHIVAVARVGFDSTGDLRLVLDAVANRGTPVAVTYTRGRPRTTEAGPGPVPDVAVPAAASS